MSKINFNFEDYPSEETPLSSDELNQIIEAVNDNDDNINNNKEEVEESISAISEEVEESISAISEEVDELTKIAIDTSVGEHEEEVVLVKTKNLFNGGMEIGGIAYQTGALENSTDRSRSINYISVEPNTDYILSRNNNTNLGLRLYGINKNYVGYVSATTNSTLQFNTGTYEKVVSTLEPVYYVKIMNVTTNLNVQYQIEKGTNATDYEEYAGVSTIYANKEKYTDTLNIGVEPNNSGLWVEHSKNLFDKDSNIISGKGLNTNGTTFDSSVSSIKQYLEIKPNTTYTYSGFSDSSYTKRICFYSSNTESSFISSVEATTDYKTFTTPSNAKYLRIQFKTSELNKVMLNEGNYIPYEPYTTPSIKVNNNGVYETIYKTVRGTTTVTTDSIGKFSLYIPDNAIGVNVYSKNTSYFVFERYLATSGQRIFYTAQVGDLTKWLTSSSLEVEYSYITTD